MARDVTRPPGRSISYSQASKNCDLDLYWHRKRIQQSHLGIALLYGRAAHKANDAFGHGHARTHEEAVRAAQAHVRTELLHPRRRTQPIRWDDPPEVNQDGAISKSKGNYGKLWCPEVVHYWLKQQVPLWLAQNSGRKLIRSEHQIFVPLTPEPHWKTPWSIECWIDSEWEGDRILDTKYPAEPWDDDKAKGYELQALLYMFAYAYHYGRMPTFEFNAMPRTFDKTLSGPKPLIQRFEVKWDERRVQNVIDGVIKPKIEMIESKAHAFTANPSGYWCSSSWCSYHDHCAFGTGKHLR